MTAPASAHAPPNSCHPSVPFVCFGCFLDNSDCRVWLRPLNWRERKIVGPEELVVTAAFHEFHPHERVAGR